jgi:hypothetical protein
METKGMEREDFLDQTKKLTKMAMVRREPLKAKAVRKVLRFQALPLNIL